MCLGPQAPVGVAAGAYGPFEVLLSLFGRGGGGIRILDAVTQA